MPTRIRLQRHGKKGKPFFHVVVADSRAKRDGRFIEKLGIYNPNTNPATIEINFDRTLEWVQKGAQPSDTARAILSYKGVLHKEHLLRGVAKGALTEAQAEAKFEKWLEEKSTKIDNKKSGLTKAQEAERKARLAAEKEKNDARAAALLPQEEVAEAAEQAGEAAAEAAADVAEAATEVAENVADAVAEVAEKVADAVEEVVEKATEAPKAEETAANDDENKSDESEEDKKDA